MSTASAHDLNSDELVDYLAQFISERKRTNIEEILNQRTKFLTVVLEDIHKSHNASAVMRTCECFGIQDIHIIEIEHEYQVHPHIASGSGLWTTATHYNDSSTNNTVNCLSKLKSEGYKILVTSLDPHSKPFDSHKIDAKTAVVFGTEYYGVSDHALALADETIHISMVGFTDSLNISVSSGIILQEYRKQLIVSDLPWQLLDAEKNALRLQWYKHSIRNCEKHIHAFMAKKNKV